MNLYISQWMWILAPPEQLSAFGSPLIVECHLGLAILCQAVVVRGRSALQGLWSVWMTANKMVFDGEHVQEAGIVRMQIGRAHV